MRRMSLAVPGADTRAPRADAASTSASTGDLAESAASIADLGGATPPPPAAGPPRRMSLSVPQEPVRETLNARRRSLAGGRETLNQYSLLAELGAGAFGTVHAAIDGATGLRVAVKECSKSALRRREMAAQFRGGPGGGRGGRGGTRGGLSSAAPTVAAPCSSPLDLVRHELAIMKKLAHPHVVRLLEVLDDPESDSLYMVFEFCDAPLLGFPLDTRPRGSSADRPKGLPEDRCRELFAGILLGVEYLHANDVVHRDIKPDNIMLRNGAVKLVDFGVSEMFAANEPARKKTAGTPAFFSPQLCTPNATIDVKAADIWALGVTLYAMRCGELPFTGETLMDLQEAIRTKDIEFREPVSPDLEDLVRKMLDKNQDTRITVDGIRGHPWVRLTVSKEDNLASMIGEVTEEDLDSAVRRIGSLFTVLKAVSKLKTSRSKSRHEMLQPNE